MQKLILLFQCSDLGDRQLRPTTFRALLSAENDVFHVSNHNFCGSVYDGIPDEVSACSNISAASGKYSYHTSGRGVNRRNLCKRLRYHLRKCGDGILPGTEFRLCAIIVHFERSLTVKKIWEWEKPKETISKCPLRSFTEDELASRIFAFVRLPTQVTTKATKWAWNNVEAGKEFPSIM